MGEEKTIIGVIGAMKEEVEPLLEYYNISEEIKINDIIFYKVELVDKILYIVESKIGKVFAAMTATLLVTKLGVDKILFTGVAGAIDENLKIGDMVISDKLVQHDFDVTEFGHGHGHIPETGTYFESCEELKKIAIEVCESEKINYKVGGIATGDQFVNCTIKKKFIKDNFNSLALEMEGGAVAQIAKYFDISFLILRSISDKAEGGANMDFDKFVKIAAVNSSKILINMIDKI